MVGSVKMRNLETLDLSDCRNLEEVHHSDIISLSERVFSIVHGGKMQQIPSWFHHQGMNKSVSVNLPENCLWDTSTANGKTPNDYGLIRLCFDEVMEYGVRLLYKDDLELEALHWNKEEKNDEPTEHSIGTYVARTLQNCCLNRRLF